MARMLGFHRINPRLAPPLQEERTRTWMAIYATGVIYHACGGRHYSISFANTDVPLWTLQPTDAKAVLYNQDKYIVHSFRGIVTFIGFMEILARIKRQHPSLNDPRSKAADPTDEKVFFEKLDSFQRCLFSWYMALPPYLYSKARKGELSIPSPRNHFACIAHILLFYHLLEVNQLRLKPQDWVDASFSKIMDSQGRLVDLISILQFHGLSAMEMCLLAAHFFVDTLSLTNGTKAIYRGPPSSGCLPSKPPCS